MEIDISRIWEFCIEDVSFWLFEPLDDKGIMAL